MCFRGICLNVSESAIFECRTNCCLIEFFGNPNLLADLLANPFSRNLVVNPTVGLSNSCWEVQYFFQVNLFLQKLETNLDCGVCNVDSSPQTLQSQWKLCHKFSLLTQSHRSASFVCPTIVVRQICTIIVSSQTTNCSERKRSPVFKRISFINRELIRTYI